MQHTTRPGWDATRRTGNGGYLFGGEFTPLHSKRMPLQPVANLYNLEQCLPLVAQTVKPRLVMSSRTSQCGELARKARRSRYSLTFHTYKKVASLAVATLRPAFRVARFSAERTFSFDCTNSANGTLSAEPALRLSRSLRIVVTISLCFPSLPCGTSDCTIVLKCIGGIFV